MTAATPGMGDNVQTKDFAKDEVDRLKVDYAYLEETVLELTDKSTPITAVTADNRDVVTGLIKDMRDAYKRINGVRESETAPNLERWRGGNGWFGSLLDKLGRKDKKAKEGEGDRLNRLLTEYDTAVLAAEQERRRREAEEAARIAREKLEAEQKAARAAAEAAAAAEEARLKAERARTEENKAARAKEAQAAAEAARAAEEALSQTRVAATVADTRAEETYIGTLAAPKDVMRARSDDGVLTGMASEKFAEITDQNELDLAKLRPYLARADLEKALRKYADSVSYSNDASVQIAGARFGKRPKSRVY